VLLIVAIGTWVAPLAAETLDPAQPALQVLEKAPLALRGTGFVPGERVTVTVTTADGELGRRTRASRLGRFVVRFDTFVDACHGARKAFAVGRRGSKASLVLERPAYRECAELAGVP
jgi:hypothetical protein